MRFGVMTDIYRDQFIGVLGHDLRSPLNAITSGAALLTISADADQRPARVGAFILRSAKRMDRMIRDLLDLTRARLGGALPLKHARTDLAQVCQKFYWKCGRHTRQQSWSSTPWAISRVIGTAIVSPKYLRILSGMLFSTAMDALSRCWTRC